MFADSKNMSWDWSHSIFAVYCGLFLVLIVRTIVGPFGTLELTFLSEREQRLMKNIKNLEKYHKVLNTRVDKLKNDDETQRLLARRLGYYQPGEQRIVIYGNHFLTHRLEIGSPLPWEERKQSKNIFFGWILVAVSVFSYIFIVVSRRKSRYF